MHADKQFFLKALPGAEIRGDAFPRYPHIAIDSRQVAKGELFLAVEGKRTDGCHYIEHALQAGAAGVIADRRKVAQIPLKGMADKLLILVDNPIEALVRLATAWREQFSIPVIGITGSVGKTSTKELVGGMLRSWGKSCCVSMGNQNSIIGASLNVLRMQADHEFAVFELGVSKRGDMEQLVRITRPTVSVITGVGHSHMAGIGSLGDIAEEKRAIFSHFKEDNIGIVNGDQPLLARVGYVHPVVKFGCKTTNQIQARKVKAVGTMTSFTLKLYGTKFPDMVIPTVHQGMVYNILAAAAVGCVLNVPYEMIVASVNKVANLPGRFEKKSILFGKGGVLIDDCYNCSPESMKESLLAFEKLSTQDCKVAVLGDMRELGVDSLFWHRQVGRFVRKVPSLEYVVFVGSDIAEAQRTLPLALPYDVVSHWKQAYELLQEKLKKQRLLLLIKGATGGYQEGLAELAKELTHYDERGAVYAKSANQLHT